jgi:hypothetical protein
MAKMEMENMITDLSVREEIIHTLLRASRKWTTVKQMTRKVKGAAAFRCQDGSPMSPQSFRVVVHRVYDALARDELIDQKFGKTKSGVMRFARWKAHPNGRNRVTPKQNRVRTRKNPHGIDTTSRSTLTSGHACPHDSYYPSAHASREALSERRRSPAPSPRHPTSDDRGETEDGCPTPPLVSRTMH